MDWAATSAAISKKEGVAGGSLEDRLRRSNLNLARSVGERLEAEVIERMSPQNQLKQDK